MINDYYFYLIHRQRAAELYEIAAMDRLARELSSQRIQERRARQQVTRRRRTWQRILSALARHDRVAEPGETVGRP